MRLNHHTASRLQGLQGLRGCAPCEAAALRGLPSVNLSTSASGWAAQTQAIVDNQLQAATPNLVATPAVPDTSVEPPVTPTPKPPWGKIALYSALVFGVVGAAMYFGNKALRG